MSIDFYLVSDRHKEMIHAVKQRGNVGWVYDSSELADFIIRAQVEKEPLRVVNEREFKTLRDKGKYKYVE